MYLRTHLATRRQILYFLWQLQYPLSHIDLILLDSKDKQVSVDTEQKIQHHPLLITLAYRACTQHKF